MKTSHLVAAATALMGLVAVNGVAGAASADQIRQLSDRANQQARQLSRQARDLPGTVPDARTLRTDATRCYSLANQIHRIVHHASQRKTIHRVAPRSVGDHSLGQLTQRVRQLNEAVRTMQVHVTRTKSVLSSRQTFAVSQELAALVQLEKTLRQLNSTVVALSASTGTPRKVALKSDRP